MLGFDNAHIKRVSEGKDLGTCIPFTWESNMDNAILFYSFNISSSIYFNIYCKKRNCEGKDSYFLYTLGRVFATIFVLVNGYGVLVVA